MLLSIGTDVELFAKDNQGKHKSLCGLIGGTKGSPRQLDNLSPGFCVQEDNVALEYNIPPCINKRQWIEANKIMLEESGSILLEYGFSISEEASVSFAKEELMHPNALLFGCEPDYNVWKLLENPKPICKDKTLRTAGGHIHVGTNKDVVDSVKLMDLFLGVPSILLDDTPSSMKRRELYGKAGALRPKSYGFEYRTLSNFWIFNDKLLSWVYEQTALAMKMSTKISVREGKYIEKTINTGDKDAARDIINTYGITLPILF